MARFITMNDETALASSTAALRINYSDSQTPLLWRVIRDWISRIILILYRVVDRHYVVTLSVFQNLLSPVVG